jgi:NAD(P)H-hydrate epimerase
MERYSADKECVVMTRDEVRAFDAWAINTLGVPGVVLMENAGRGCAELIQEKLSGVARPKVCIFCGTGNNGGDGLDILEGLGQGIEQLNLEQEDIAGRIGTFAAGADMIVDGLFGTGLKGQLSEEYKQLIEAINAQEGPIVAIDIPSGLDCDSGQPLGAAVKASCTVTFVAVKKGFIVEEAAGQYTGEVLVASIGVEPTE